MRRLFAPLLLALMLLIAPAAALAQEVNHGINPADMDLTADPRQDFYRYANGGWLDRTEIPADKADYGTFSELQDATTQQLLGILHAAAGDRSLAEDSDTAKAVRFWQQGTDVPARDALSVSPLEPILAEIEGIADLPGYHAFLRGALFRGAPGSLPLGVQPDLRASDVNAVYLGGPWLGLPNRDFYLEEGNEAVRAAYVATNAAFLGRLGKDSAAALAAAQAVYDFEATLAATTLTREALQNPANTYTPLSIAELTERYPGMDWPAYLAEMGIGGTERVIVTGIGYLDQLAAILEQTPIETLRDYLRVQLL